MPDRGRLKEAVRPYYLRWLYFPLRPGRRPEAFRNCWKYPFQKLTDPGAARLPESPSQLPALLFYPMNDWHARIQRAQHLVRALAGLGHRCIYLNPHLGREFETTPLFDRAHRLTQLEENIFELHVRLPREPVFHDRLLTAGEEDTIVEVMRSILPREGTAIQISSFPLWLGVARRFRRELGFPIIYDCHDLLSGFQKICRELIATETDLLHEADLVLFSSQGLQDRYAGEVRRPLLVRNGVTAGEFEIDGTPPPGPPRVGYVGALDTWFDSEAVRLAAAANPQCRFIIAGRMEYPPIRRLATMANVELPGEIPYSRVPGLLRELRVALIPFTINPLTLMTNPIKLYEYFSCGLPVVSAPLPEAQAMGDLVYVGNTPAEFARQVTRALGEDDPRRRARRKEIAAKESWAARAGDISAKFGALLNR